MHPPRDVSTARAWARAFVAHGGRATLEPGGQYGIYIPEDFRNDVLPIEEAPPHTWPLSKEGRAGALRGLEMVLMLADRHSKDDMLEIAYRLSTCPT